MVRILVLEREKIFRGGEFTGFISKDQRDLTSIIMNDYFYHERGDDLEKNKKIQQIIPYVWFVNPEKKQVFLYLRVLNKSDIEAGTYVEERYLGDYSGGVGGHADEMPGVTDPIFSTIERELREEVEMDVYPVPSIVGYINDDSDEFNSVHFGVVALAETTEDIKGKSKQGLADGRWYDIEEADKIISEDKAEKWTKHSWPFVKDYLQKL